MSETHEEPRVLILHRRELHDVCRQLEALGVAYEERQTVSRPGSGNEPWRLVVATPQRVLELRASRNGDVANLVAVCDGFSKTLAAKLARARVDFILRRPVHPGALRLLLLHVLYRGPERRQDRRVSVGAPVRVRLGWRRRSAMLLELSTTGCRVQVAGAASPDARISIVLPAELTGKPRAWRLRGRVVRSLLAKQEAGPDGQELAVRFEALARGASQTLADLVRRFGTGPASWKDAPRPEPRSQPVREDDASPAPSARDAQAPERRRSPRLRYAKPVLVKGDGASRVLMGRDLSTGGMRVLRDPNLEIGDQLKIALYGEEGIPPVMLQAEVAREDGPFLVLRFEDPGDAGLEQLQRILTSLPVSGSDDSGQTTPLVVSEIVERR